MRDIRQSIHLSTLTGVSQVIQGPADESTNKQQQQQQPNNINLPTYESRRGIQRHDIVEILKIIHTNEFVLPEPLSSAPLDPKNPSTFEGSLGLKSGHYLRYSSLPCPRCPNANQFRSTRSLHASASDLMAQCLTTAGKVFEQPFQFPAEHRTGQQRPIVECMSNKCELDDSEGTDCSEYGVLDPTIDKCDDNRSLVESASNIGVHSSLVCEHNASPSSMPGDVYILCDDTRQISNPENSAQDICGSKCRVGDNVSMQSHWWDEIPIAQPSDDSPTDAECSSRVIVNERDFKGRRRNTSITNRCRRVYCCESGIDYTTSSRETSPSHGEFVFPARPEVNCLSMSCPSLHLEPIEFICKRSISMSAVASPVGGDRCCNVGYPWQQARFSTVTWMSSNADMNSIYSDIVEEDVDEFQSCFLDDNFDDTFRNTTHHRVPPFSSHADTNDTDLEEYNRRHACGLFPNLTPVIEHSRSAQNLLCGSSVPSMSCWHDEDRQARSKSINDTNLAPSDDEFPFKSPNNVFECVTVNDANKSSPVSHATQHHDTQTTCIDTRPACRLPQITAVQGMDNGTDAMCQVDIDDDDDVNDDDDDDDVNNKETQCELPTHEVYTESLARNIDHCSDKHREYQGKGSLDASIQSLHLRITNKALDILAETFANSERQLNCNHASCPNIYLKSIWYGNRAHKDDTNPDNKIAVDIYAKSKLQQYASITPIKARGRNHLSPIPNSGCVIQYLNHVVRFDEDDFTKKEVCRQTVEDVTQFQIGDRPSKVPALAEAPVDTTNEETLCRSAAGDTGIVDHHRHRSVGDTGIVDHNCHRSVGDTSIVDHHRHRSVGDTGIVDHHRHRSVGDTSIVDHHRHRSVGDTGIVDHHRHCSVDCDHACTDSNTPPFPLSMGGRESKLDSSADCPSSVDWAEPAHRLDEFNGDVQCIMNATTRRLCLDDNSHASDQPPPAETSSSVSEALLHGLNPTAHFLPWTNVDAMKETSIMDRIKYLESSEAVICVDNDDDIENLSKRSDISGSSDFSKSESYSPTDDNSSRSPIENYHGGPLFAVSSEEREHQQKMIDDVIERFLSSKLASHRSNTMHRLSSDEDEEEEEDEENQGIRESMVPSSISNKSNSRISSVDEYGHSIDSNFSSIDPSGINEYHQLEHFRPHSLSTILSSDGYQECNDLDNSSDDRLYKDNLNESARVHPDGCCSLIARSGSPTNTDCIWNVSTTKMDKLSSPMFNADRCLIEPPAAVAERLAEKYQTVKSWLSEPQNEHTVAMAIENAEHQSEMMSSVGSILASHAYQPTDFRQPASADSYSQTISVQCTPIDESCKHERSTNTYRSHSVAVQVVPEDQEDSGSESSSMDPAMIGEDDRRMMCMANSAVIFTDGRSYSRVDMLYENRNTTTMRSAESPACIQCKSGALKIADVISIDIDPQSTLLDAMFDPICIDQGRGFQQRTKSAPTPHKQNGRTCEHGSVNRKAKLTAKHGQDIRRPSFAYPMCQSSFTSTSGVQCSLISEPPVQQNPACKLSRSSPTDYLEYLPKHYDKCFVGDSTPLYSGHVGMECRNRPKYEPRRNECSLEGVAAKAMQSGNTRDSNLRNSSEYQFAVQLLRLDADRTRMLVDHTHQKVNGMLEEVNTIISSLNTHRVISESDLRADHDLEHFKCLQKVINERIVSEINQYKTSLQTNLDEVERVLDYVKGSLIKNHPNNSGAHRDSRHVPSNNMSKQRQDQNNNPAADTGRESSCMSASSSTMALVMDKITVPVYRHPCEVMLTDGDHVICQPHDPACCRRHNHHNQYVSMSTEDEEELCWKPPLLADLEPNHLTVLSDINNLLADLRTLHEESAVQIELARETINYSDEVMRKIMALKKKPESSSSKVERYCAKCYMRGDSSSLLVLSKPYHPDVGNCTTVTEGLHGISWTNDSVNLLIDISDSSPPPSSQDTANREQCRSPANNNNKYYSSNNNNKYYSNNKYYRSEPIESDQPGPDLPFNSGSYRQPGTRNSRSVYRRPSSA